MNSAPRFSAADAATERGWKLEDSKTRSKTFRRAALIDRTRRLLDVSRLKNIFGPKDRPQTALGAGGGNHPKMGGTRISRFEPNLTNFVPTSRLQISITAISGRQLKRRFTENQPMPELT